MSETLVAFAAVFLGLVFTGAPVAWAMAISTIVWIVISDRLMFLPVIPERIFQGIDVFVLMAVPLFILAGELINESRIAERLIRAANVFFGWIAGGLAQVNIGASILFSGITGVALGDIATLGRVFIPSMVKHGFSPAYAAAVTAASSIIGPLVPPSLVVIIYGSMVDVSIAALFAACILPGIVVGLAQMVLVCIQSRRADMAPVKVDRSPRALVAAGRDVLVPISVPVVVLAGILGGVMTPTEAGAVAALYALIVGMLFFRTIRPRALPAVFERSMLFTARLLIIVGCGAAFSWVMGMENVPAMLSAALSGWEMGPAETLIVFNLFLLLAGMFIDPTAAIILFGPTLSAAATSIGIDPVHFGVVVILNLNIGLLTPPLGVCLFAAQDIAGCSLPALVRAVAPFLGINLLALGLITYLPALSLTLPRALGF